MNRDLGSANVEFLFTELETGLTFARLASAAKDNPTKVERNTRNARKAYDSLLHFQERVSLSPEAKVKFEAGKDELRDSLRLLGEKV
ncbi:MAG TPA: hypothetical protein VI685_25710 [Candidatus Angelobacter sp.]